MPCPLSIHFIARVASDVTKTINDAVEELMQASHQLAAEMYKQAGPPPGGEGAAGPGPEQAQEAGADEADESSGDSGDGAVDADFEVVDDDEKK